MVADAIVRWNARIFKTSAAKRRIAVGTKYPESRSNPAKSWTPNLKSVIEIAMKNRKANGSSGGG